MLTDNGRGWHAVALELDAELGMKEATINSLAGQVRRWRRTAYFAAICLGFSLFCWAVVVIILVSTG